MLQAQRLGMHTQGKQRLRVLVWLLFVWSLPVSLFGMQVALGLGALLLLIGFFVTRFESFQPSALDLPVMVLLGSIALSLLLTPYEITSFQTATSFWVLIAFYFTGHAVQKKTDLIRALVGLFVLTAFAVGFGIFQAWTHSYPLGHLIHPHAENLLKPVFGLPNKVAAMGFFSSRLTFAHVLLFAFCWAVGLALESAFEKRLRVVLVGLAMVTAVGMFISYTRASLAVAAVLFVVLTLTKYHHKRRVWVAVMCGALVVFAALPLMAPQVVKRMTSSFSNSRDWNRLLIWQVALDLASQHPFTGVGYGNFQRVSQDPIDRRVRAMGAKRFYGVRAFAHNNLLTFLAEAGGIGAFAFCFLFFVYFREAYRSLIAIDDEEALLRGFVRGSMAAVAGFLMVGMFHDTFFDGEVVFCLWFCMGASLAVSRLVQPKKVVQ